jgi:23S rRNA pseudouridine1911/1915/1917 synthase
VTPKTPDQEPRAGELIPKSAAASAAKGRFEFRVPENAGGQRIDQVLAACVPDLSRRRARVALEIGAVFVDRQRVKVAGRKLRAGQHVAVHLGGALARASGNLGAKARSEDEAKLPPFSVLYEDDALVVVNKPAGLLSAPTPESDRSNLLSLLSRRDGGRMELWVVHRLDLQTSGVMCFAKSDAANRALGEMFRAHRLLRRYTAFAGGSAPERFSVDAPVSGKTALTHFQCLWTNGAISQLEATLETGRTHQIRLHLLKAGYPVLGDPAYALRQNWHPPRLGLHAHLLAFQHPLTGAQLNFEAPLPADLDYWFQAHRATAAPLPLPSAPEDR